MPERLTPSGPANTPEGTEPENALTVLHITEAFGGGLYASLATLVRQQLEVGILPTIAYHRRPDTPPESELDLLAEAGARIVELGSGPMTPRAVFLLARRIRRLVNDTDPDVVHLHSSWTGLLGRVAALGVVGRHAMFYSPHGFAFLRKDLSRRARVFAYTVEFLLSLAYPHIVLAGEAEQRLSRRSLWFGRHHLVRNEGRDVFTAARPVPEKPVVITVGRIAPQKAPWKFQALADILHDKAEFVWIGDGEPDNRWKWIHENGSVELTGWLHQNEVREWIGRATVFVLLSSWEGLPMALIEAQLAGVPAVVHNIRPNEEVVLDGKTGFICRDIASVAERVDRLIVNDHLNQRLGRAARERALVLYASEQMGQQSLDIYRPPR